jgi:hypothetical protein
MNVTRMSDVEPERIHWLWPGRIPRGKLTLLEGDPKVGKSTLTLDLAARVSAGRPMPDGQGGSAPSAVLLLTAEDGLADTVRPRLDAAGADSAMVFVWDSVSRQDVDGSLTEHPPSLPGDIPLLMQLIQQWGIKLVVVDVLNAYLHSSVDGYRDQDIRRALMPLARMAEDTGAAVVVLRHLTKAVGTTALYRGAGSVGIAGAARSILLVATDPDDETHSRMVLASTACNVAGSVPSLVYQLVSDEDRGCASVEWLGETHHTSDDLLSVTGNLRGGQASSAAEDWVNDHLADGRKKASESYDEWDKARLGSRSTLSRVLQKLGVVSKREGFGPKAVYWWELPHHARQDDLTSMDFSCVDEHGEGGSDLGVLQLESATSLHAPHSGEHDSHGLSAEPSSGTVSGVEGVSPSVRGEAGDRDDDTAEVTL